MQLMQVYVQKSMRTILFSACSSDRMSSSELIHSLTPSPLMRGAVKVSSVTGSDRVGVGAAMGVGSAVGTASTGTASVVESSLPPPHAARNASPKTVRRNAAPRTPASLQCQFALTTP